MKKPNIYIIIAILVVAIVVGVIIYKNYMTIKDTKTSNDLVDKVNKEIIASDVTLTKAQLMGIVEKLYVAMDGWGTDTDAVYSAFEMAATRSDILSIIGTFGVKDGETLNEWIQGDLSGSEIAHLNSIIASKGINYQF